METDKSTKESNQSEDTKPRLNFFSPPDKSENQLINKLITACLEQVNFTAATMQLVNDIAFHLQCDRVSIGMRHGQHVALAALSNNAKFDDKTNLIRGITSVMDEAIDEKSNILFPPLNDESLTINTAHSQLAKMHGDWTIYTVPLQCRGDYIGAICVECSSKNELSNRVINNVELLARFVGPILYILQQEQRSLVKRTIDSFNGSLIKLFGRNNISSTLAMAFGVCALAFLSFYTGEYRITADAVMEGRIQRVIAAPISGYIGTANKRAGDLVRAGDIIATLDDKDLKLEAAKLESQRQQLQREYRESLATNNRSTVRIISARLNQIDAKRELATEQLSRLKLTAPITGIIIEGDLNQSIGSPVTRGDVLYKVAPADDYRIVLNIDESEISHIKTGQNGRLALAALPDSTLDITVTKITPVSISSDGRTYFHIEAKLEDVPKGLQPGMEGIGKIYIGEKKYFWILTHKIINQIRILLWKIWL